MRPSLVLRVYCAISFVLGLGLCVPMALLTRSGEFSGHDAAILTLCFNTLLVMVLPLILDWSERTYFKARFVQLEELERTNPELKAALDEQCEKLRLPGLRLATVETAGSLETTFSYGLFRQNPRLVVPSSWLHSTKLSAPNVVPSIQGELNRFASRDISLIFFGFSLVQFGVQQLLLHVVLH